MQLKFLNIYIVYTKKEKSGHNKLWLPLAASVCKILYLFNEMDTKIIIWFLTSTILRELLHDELLTGVHFHDYLCLGSVWHIRILLPESATVYFGQRLQHSWVTGEPIYDSKTVTDVCEQRLQGLMIYPSRWSQYKQIEVYK